MQAGRRSKSTFQTIQNSPSNDFSMINENGMGSVTKDEGELMHYMISIIKRYEVGIQKLNRLRFEAHREDRSASGLITKDFFKQMQKRFGMSVSSTDQRDMYAFFQMGVPSQY